MSELVTCKDLTKRFGNHTALDHLNLSLDSGKIIGLLGPNGSGKTTLLKLLNGLLTPSEGEVLIAGNRPGIETKRIVSYLPEGPKYFPDDMMTDQPERQICAEIIREKALLHLREEVPHGIGVEMMAINKLSDNLTEIHATIYCERASHKGIIIGKQGAMLRTIGAEARRDIENLLGTKVNLQLWVKIREDWRNRMDDLRTLGYESN